MGEGVSLLALWDLWDADGVPPVEGVPMKSELLWCFTHNSVPMSESMCPYGANEGCDIFFAVVTRVEDQLEPILCECSSCHPGSVFDGDPDDGGYDEWA